MAAKRRPYIINGNIVWLDADKASPPSPSVNSAALSSESATDDDVEPDVKRRAYGTQGPCSASRVAIVFAGFCAMCLGVYAVGPRWGVWVVMLAIALSLCAVGLGRRRAGELSAYSVFNQGFQALDGSLKAEQFDAEIRGGVGAVRRQD